jgi:hypothetical protein
MKERARSNSTRIEKNMKKSPLLLFEDSLDIELLMGLTRNKMERMGRTVPTKRRITSRKDEILYPVEVVDSI